MLTINKCIEKDLQKSTSYSVDFCCCATLCIVTLNDRDGNSLHFYLVFLTVKNTAEVICFVHYHSLWVLSNNLSTLRSSWQHKPHDLSVPRN